MAQAPAELIAFVACELGDLLISSTRCRVICRMTPPVRHASPWSLLGYEHLLRSRRRASPSLRAELAVDPRTRRFRRVPGFRFARATLGSLTTMRAAARSRSGSVRAASTNTTRSRRRCTRASRRRRLPVATCTGGSGGGMRIGASGSCTRTRRRRRTAPIGLGEVAGPIPVVGAARIRARGFGEQAGAGRRGENRQRCPVVNLHRKCLVGAWPEPGVRSWSSARGSAKHEPDPPRTTTFAAHTDAGIRRRAHACSQSPHEITYAD